ncbi:MAG: hypothetical protein KBC81_03085 [Candidatus Pacebacteria bacterium]|nr:hypothetical protein [Candidatus Paceibacterota bacterium]
MNKENILTVVAVVAVAAILGFWLFWKPDDKIAVSPSPTPSPVATATMIQYNQSVSDKDIKVSYSSSDFGLATTPAQIVVKSYIPPCETGFDYCLYSNNDTYKGTNFESAGLRIAQRKDLSTKEQCLNTLPTGYTSLTPVSFTSANYATSVFSPLGDAAAGHYSSGAQYRLWSGKSCYELESRIGETQFANYPAGSIKQFTDADRISVRAQLAAMLNAITLTGGEKVSFPQAKTAQ